MSTTTFSLIGPRMTARPAGGPFGPNDTPAVGSVLFAVRRTVEDRNARTWVELRDVPGRLNLSRAVASRGQWMGTTNGVSEVQLGRVVVVAELADGWRVQVRAVDEGPDDFADACAEAFDAAARW